MDHPGISIAPIKRKVVSLSASGDVIDAIVGKKIEVVYWDMVVTTSVTVKWQSGATSDISPAYPFGANGGIAPGLNMLGFFETVSGEKLNLVLGSGVAVAGLLLYQEIG